MPEYSIFKKTLSLKSLWRIAFVWLHVFDLVSWQCVDLQLKSKRTSMWKIQIKFKWFCWEEKLFLEQKKEKI